MNNWQDFQQAAGHEWLETNGLGGWSASTVAGCHTRRYHGLLVAAVVPPTDRMVFVSKLDETIVIGGSRFELGANAYDDVIHPQGYSLIAAFEKTWFPTWIYQAGGVQLRKTVAMIHGANTVTVTYEVIAAPGPFILELLPLLAVRGYHQLTHANEAINKTIDFTAEVFSVQAYAGTPRIYIEIPGAEFIAGGHWYNQLHYPIERYRGMDDTEDLYSHGHFQVSLRAGDRLGIILSTEEDVRGKDAWALLDGELLRRQALVGVVQRGDAMWRQLILAADQFIVRRGEGLKTVIAGYHWFTDWGRDTMIALPGLCLATGRPDDAKKILAAFAGSVSEGMLPNRFADNGAPPEYNNVDGTLWYFIAIHHYLGATGDRGFVLEELLPVLKGIIDWHFRWTRYHIHAEESGLLYAGEEGWQLTWMDAKIGDQVITPRIGKPVEVQALWYNALRIFAMLLRLNGQEEDAARVNATADMARSAFAALFWNEAGGCLYDVIDPGENPDPSLRPNQLFALSLPYPLLEGARAEAVLAIVTKELYTPAGLRSLAPGDSRYIGHYGGNMAHRDGAYHQGTAWNWLLGPYIDALIKVRGDRAAAQAVVDSCRPLLAEGAIGTLAEIFDGDAPFSPRGCVAQAWSVGELLRVMHAYELFKP